MSEETEIKKTKKNVGRPAKVIIVDQVSEDDVNEEEILSSDSSDEDPIPVEVKKKKKVTEKQLQNLAKARATRQKELSHYNESQKEKAVKKSKEFFDLEIKKQVDQHLQMEKLKWIKERKIEEKRKQKEKEKETEEIEKPKPKSKSKPVVVKKETVQKIVKKEKAPKQIFSQQQSSFDPFDEFC